MILTRLARVQSIVEVIKIMTIDGHCVMVATARWHHTRARGDGEKEKQDENAARDVRVRTRSRVYFILPCR
jgi:hypothetical protein